MSRFTKFAASVAAGTMVAGGALVLSAPSASAADVQHYAEHQLVVVELNHAETVTAAQIGAGNVINAVLGNDHWKVGLETGSKYQDGAYYRPDKARTWNNVTGQQVVHEAASHPNGTITLGVFYGDSDTEPLWVIQDW